MICKPILHQSPTKLFWQLFLGLHSIFQVGCKAAIWLSERVWWNYCDLRNLYLGENVSQSEAKCLSESKCNIEELAEMVFLTSALCARVAKHTNEFFGRAQVIYFLQVFKFSLQYINCLYFWKAWTWPVLEEAKAVHDDLPSIWPR